MVAFAFRRAGGIWASDSVFGPDDAADFDLKLTKCLNAAEGGTWSPSSEIEVGGAGIRVTTLLKSDGKFQAVQGSFSSTLDVTGSFTVGLGYGGNFTPDLAVTASGNGLGLVQANSPFVAKRNVDLGDSDHVGTYTLTVHSGAHFRAGMLVEGGGAGGSYFDGNVGISGNLTLHSAFAGGDVYLTGSNYFGGDNDPTSFNYLRAPLSATGLGRVLRRAKVGGAGVLTYGPWEVQWVNFPANSLSATQNATISGSHALPGDCIGFTNRSGYTLNILDDGGTLLIAIPPSHWAVFLNIEGAWCLIQFGSFYAHSVAD